MANAAKGGIFGPQRIPTLFTGQRWGSSTAVDPRTLDAISALKLVRSGFGSRCFGPSYLALDALKLWFLDAGLGS